jgi:hypothetical protein
MTDWTDPRKMSQWELEEYLDAVVHAEKELPRARGNSFSRARRRCSMI